MKPNIYIDAANLHIGSLELGFKIDYKKFIGWLRQKYNYRKVYLFIGYIPEKQDLYKKLEIFGYKLVFKETVTYPNKTIKGNCGSELVLKVCVDFYEKQTKDFILITSDGDFTCLVKFLLNKRTDIKIISPNKRKCSPLLRKSGAKIIYLKDHYHKSIKK